MVSKCCNAPLKKEHIHICSFCLKGCNTKYNTKVIPYILVFIGLNLLVLSTSSTLVDLKKAPGIKQYLENQDIALEDSIILSELKANDILFPEIVLAQAHLETGNFTSNICKENHNLFGIKYINRKPYQVKELNNHCYYNSYKDCIKDYKLTQKFYLNNIDKKYAEDSNYTDKLKKVNI